jgi:outer membrane protein TolC
MAEEALRVAMHQGASTAMDIGEDIFRDLPAVEGADDFEALVKEAASQRVELKALGEAVASAQAQRSGLWANAVPRLDATANAMYANPNPRYQPAEPIWHGTWDVGVVVSWQPSDLPATLAALNGAGARTRQLEAQRDALLDALQLEVRQAWLALRESEVAITSTTAALASSEESYRVRQELFRNGRATVVEVLDAETELTRARLEAINARIDARVARVRLDHATGRDTASK